MGKDKTKKRCFADIETKGKKEIYPEQDNLRKELMLLTKRSILNLNQSHLGSSLANARMVNIIKQLNSINLFEKRNSSGLAYLSCYKNT
jgi:hypothetical protein